MADLPIINVNYGLGSSYTSFIEVNHKLPKELRYRVIAHEQNHANSDKYTKQDFLNDFQSNNSYFFESLKFALSYPEALVGFFPFMYCYYKKIWTYNSSALYPFIWFGLIFSGFFAILFNVNFFLAFLGYAIMFVILNAILIILTHIIVRRDKGFIYKEQKPNE